MPRESSVPQRAPMDALHSVKNAAARTAAKRMVLESNAAEVAARLVAHEGEMARRLDLARHRQEAYPQEERLADKARHAALIEEHNHATQALAGLDALREKLSQQADEVLAERCVQDLAALSAQIGERVRRFFTLWRQVLHVVKDIEALCHQHRQLRQALIALRARQGRPSVLPPEARLPHSLEEMHQAVSGVSISLEPFDHGDGLEAPHVTPKR